MTTIFSGRKFNEKQHFVQTVEAPDALFLQFMSFNKLFSFGACTKNKEQELLYKILKIHFPIKNINGNIVLDFVNYTIDPPKYSPEESLKLGISYAVSLTIKFRLIFYDKSDILEQDVYFGEVPYMTESGSFIYHGIERVCVPQIQKATGIAFVSTNKQNNITDYVCKIVPSKGTWVEIIVSAKKILYFLFNKKVKILLSDFLKVFGEETQKSLLEIVDIVEEVPCNKKNLEKYIGERIATDIQIKKEIPNGKNKQEKIQKVLNIGDVITAENISNIIESGLKNILVFKCDKETYKKYEPLINTVANMSSEDPQDLALKFYKQFNSGYRGNDKEMALAYIKGILKDEKLFSIEDIGRRKINSIVGFAKEDEFKKTLTPNDFRNIIKYFLDVINGEKQVEDIDHYGNKCLKTIGEQFYDEFYISFLRISRLAKERLNVCDKKNINIYNLINCGIFTSIINQFFATNQYMQFMDELNPLAKIMHKRRISAIGVGGITAESKSTDIRDIHYSQYGKVCPIETPEGQNIGLISALASYAKCDDCGVIITPYRKVINGVIDLDNNHIVYLDANQDIYNKIAPANINYDNKGNILDEYVKVRYLDTFKKVKKTEVNYIDISPNQAFSVGTSLIPFLENDDSSRALMGTNMQRQAVPLLKPQAPIVGTGIEKKICKDSRDIIYAEHNGTIKYVDARKIIVEYDLSEDEELCCYDEKIKEYKLTKFRKTNQKTCINHIPIVEVGQRVREGDPLVEGFSTNNGELALGINLKVAFMTYKGYNYEDAIVISDRVVKEDLLTSIFMEKYETYTKKTKLCDEEFTKDLSEMNKHDIENLEENGLIKIGSHVEEGDILVGKIKPKTSANVTPETKLLKEIFHERAYDMYDDSLLMPPFSQGVVVDAQIYKRQNYSKNGLVNIKRHIAEIQQTYIQKLNDFKEIAIKKFAKLLNGVKSNLIMYEYGEVVMEEDEIFSEEKIRNKFFCCIEYEFPEYIVLKHRFAIEDIICDDWTKDKKKNDLVIKLVNNTVAKINDIRNEFYKIYYKMLYGDYIDSDVLSKAEVTVAHKRKLQVGDKLSGRHGNKGVVSKICRAEDMPFMADGTPVDLVLTPLGVPSRMNLGQIYETLLGWAGEVLGCKYVTPIFAGYDLDSINHELEKAKLPQFGETQLYDGLTGEAFDQTCTVGTIYFIKLNHMVDDKVHARSIGQYSMISQQPLSGRAHAGGQRFGEMEVWALEAYGAANLLQEMLTIKSDDIKGRRATYEAIINGREIPEYGIPESFYVLVQEIRGMGFDLIFE